MKLSVHIAIIIWSTPVQRVLSTYNKVGFWLLQLNAWASTHLMEHNGIVRILPLQP